MRRCIDPKCKACSGTGKNSRGRLCAPCQVNGEPVPPARPVEAVQNTDGSIDVEGKAHHRCATCWEWFKRGALIKADTKGLANSDGLLRCGPCHRGRAISSPVVDPALEGFL